MRGKGRVVLVVDDDRGIRESLRVRLSAEGFEVVLAAGGREAVSVLSALTPDALILDANMPDMNGLSVCEEVRSSESCAGVPVIFLSGAETPSAEYVQRCATIVGATHFLRKPCDHGELLDLLDRLALHRVSAVC